MKIAQYAFALIGVLFGLVTLVAGTRVLLGTDPEYAVYRPLLIYNAGMGIAYVAAGFIAFRNVRNGMYAAAVIFALNLVVLAAIYYLYTTGSPVAVDSLRAMTLRTLVWLTLFAGLGWVSRKRSRGRYT